MLCVYSYSFDYRLIEQQVDWSSIYICVYIVHILLYVILYCVCVSFYCFFLHVSVFLCSADQHCSVFTQLSRLVAEQRVAYPECHCRYPESSQILVWPLQQPSIVAAKVNFVFAIVFTWDCFWLQIESRVHVTSYKLDCDKFDLSDLRKNDSTLHNRDKLN